MQKIQLKVLDPRLAETFGLPAYATGGSAAMDIRACLEEPLTVKPDACEAVAKVDAEIPPAAVVVAKEGVPENPDPTARFGMKYGTDDKNSTDWMK